MSQKVSLSAYFERIGFAGSIAPTLATLEALHALHPAAIPFENLNPLLGLPVSLELPAILKKLLADKRGGYCFEHNHLLLAVLRELDFSVRGLGARVLWNNPDAVNVPVSHMLLAVDLGGTTYLADPGFGRMALTAPLKLRPEVEQATPHDTYRLLENDKQWRLEAKAGDDWRPLYRFDLTEYQPADYLPLNTQVSTDPASPFTFELRVALSPPGKRLVLHNNRFSTHPVGAPSETRLLGSVAELREVLSGPFGIALPPAELLDPKLEAILAEAEAGES